MKGQAKIEERMRCYCAVIVGTAVTVGSAAYAAKTQHDQAKAQSQQAADAQSTLAGNPSGAYGSKLDPPDYQDNVGEFAMGQQIFEDFQDSMPYTFEISRRMNAEAMNRRNQTAGGKLWTNVLNQQGQNINQMQKGVIPGDVQSEIQRRVAELAGGSFDPTQPGGFGGGLSQMGSGLARSLGMTSYDIMNQGMSMAPAWQKSVDDFTYKPQDVVKDAGTFLSAAQLQLKRDQQQYEGDMNTAIAASRPDPQVTGALNDRMRIGQIQSTAEANEARAMQGLVTAGVSGATQLYNQYKTPAPVVARPTGRVYQPGTGMVQSTVPINRNGIIT